MSNSKLLLVDDEPLNLKLFQKMLKDNDYQIITATNGQECLAKAEETNPDLILMDWNMPVMDGLEALKRLKKDEATKDIPVLMITGVMTSSEDLALAMSIGAIDFLKKPFEKLELNARINNILLLSNTLKVLKDQNNSLENKNIFISSLLESVPHPVIYCSLEGVLLMCNHFFEKLIDKNKVELLGKSIYRLFLSEEIGFHVQKDIELVEKGTALAYEKNGFPGNKTFIISKNVVRDSHNKPLGIITAFTDISELKKANEDIINNKKIELISSALKMTHLNEMNTSLINDLEKVLPHATKRRTGLDSKNDQ